MEEFKKIILKNGLRVILAPQKGFASTALVLVEAGSEYETRKINGLSHFLEHLMFKGTEKRPRPGTIAEELDALGAEYNAFTGQEYTGYWAKAQSEKLLKILEIVSDLYLNPTFNPEEMDKERGVVIEEINMYEDTPMRRVQEIFAHLLYCNQPAGWDIGGRKEVIRRLTREELVAYRDKHYVAGATVVVIAGEFDQKRVLDSIRELFSRLKRGRKVIKTKTKERQSRPGIISKFKESDQTHLVIGTRAFDIFDKRRYALQVLADMVGGGMSSRLFHRIREELGAAYYIRAGSDLFLDHGYFSVSAGVDHKKLEIVIGAILEELRRLSREPVSSNELKKSKDHIVGNFILGLETSDQLAGFYGGQEVLSEKMLKPKDIMDKIQKVSSDDVRAVASQIFRNEKLNMALIGPYKKTETFKKILRFK
ncbi:MAG: insulinase family protein [Candidatus Liptonbacteria bacterium]|nr:insulinase family protein [Candidatus Liptonbacteria bacterium]